MYFHNSRRALATACIGLSMLATGAFAQNVDWPYYGGDQGGMKYSSLTQINQSNVSSLKLAWQWKTGETTLPEYGTKPGSFEVTPLVVEGTMYLSTGYNRVVALNAVTGEVKWIYDPEAYKMGPPFNGTGLVHRGLAMYKDPSTGKYTIFMNSRTSLIAIDAATGKVIPTFGANGKVDLLKGLRWEIDPKRYSNTSPPMVYKNLVIVGNGVGDRLMYKKDPPGDVRAYDVHTGKQVWSFHTIPYAGEFGADTWKDNSNEYTGHANVWPPMSLDDKRGLLYLPVTTPSNDFYGARRKGQGLFADTLVCVDALTGKRVWHYQLVHHGLWDYDPPSPPSLISITINGKKIDAVVQPTKQGFLFAFDRVTGKPVWPIVEKPVEASTVKGEESWPTQPFPTLPDPIAPQGVSLDDANDLTPQIHEEALARLKTMKLGPLYTPPSYEGTMMRPGILGGANWGGAAYDPQTHMMFIKVNNQPALAKLGLFDKSGPRAAEVDSDYVTEGRTNAILHDNISILKGPYSFVTAIDMNTGKKTWQVPFGDDAEMRANPVLKGATLPKSLGAVGTSGAIVTRTGIIFVGGGDAAFHAIDEKDGHDLWVYNTRVRTGGTPMTYMINGKQYVAIAVGSGDDTSLLVFSL